MSGKYSYNYLIRYNTIIVTLIAIATQFLRVHAISLPMFIENEPVVLLSWEDYASPIDHPSVPDDCKNSAVCEYVKNYPTELVAIIMNKLRMKNITSFTNDQLYDSEYSNSVGELLDLCETGEEKIIFPLAAKDRFKKWQYILNLQGHYFQSFRVHECLDVPETTCSHAARVTDTDYVLECEQQFSRREMVYLNIDKKVVQTGYFSIPNCCSCHLEPR